MDRSAPNHFCARSFIVLHPAIQSPLPAKGPIRTTLPMAEAKDFVGFLTQPLPELSPNCLGPTPLPELSLGF